MEKVNGGFRKSPKRAAKQIIKYIL